MTPRDPLLIDPVDRVLEGDEQGIRTEDRPLDPVVVEAIATARRVAAIYVPELWMQIRDED
jgi:hypothetical protein